MALSGSELHRREIALRSRLEVYYNHETAVAQSLGGVSVRTDTEYFVLRSFLVTVAQRAEQSIIEGDRQLFIKDADGKIMVIADWCRMSSNECSRHVQCR